MRGFTDFILKLHTGESIAAPDWTWQQRQKLGQVQLVELAEDILLYWEDKKGTISSSTLEKLSKLRKSLELDGYEFRGAKLLVPEADVVDVEEETGVLHRLYDDLALPNREVAFHHLSLSEEHYLAAHWDDSISNSRKFLEVVVQEVAAKHHLATHGAPMSDAIYSRPARVRDYLETSGLLESKEKQTLASVYALLSETGAHPYMAANDQARLLRHLALTLSQFVMLRLRGAP